ncbi:hypothetical protein Taro_039420 [Colocasia esculenta]|uniref:DNA-directed RNA polymerase n=1 Tax=Colocasia esculenta TaxID=4460 RepID=A0A843WFQ7_COLES|nr:hypothetical protein [Colocasia esculenta]
MMHCLIFMGPTFYQRLIHIAKDKVNFRNTVPVHPLTRQPIADRKRFGGVRFGEIERDCLLAHVAAANLHECLFTLNDSSHMHVCQTCTRVANVIQRPVPGGKKGTTVGVTRRGRGWGSLGGGGALAQWVAVATRKEEEEAWWVVVATRKEEEKVEWVVQEEGPSQWVMAAAGRKGGTTAEADGGGGGRRRGRNNSGGRRWRRRA